MPTLKSVLDTVRITASRVFSADRNGFYRRQKTGNGRYFDSNQIAKIHPFETSDLLARVPSLRLTQIGVDDRTALMRSFAGGYCQPSFFIDGMLMRSMSVRDLDVMVNPDEVQGMEIYTSVLGIPPEFLTGLGNCGAVVVWTQPRRRVKR